MSDSSFDDSLDDGYFQGDKEIFEDSYDEDTKFKPNMMLGLAIGIAVTLAFELGVGLALDVQTNLVHRYIAYLLGLVPLLITAFYTRSVLKMFFIATPILIGTSFALPFLLPDIFSGLMTPFLTLIPIVGEGREVLTSLGVLDGTYSTYFEFVDQFGIALDLLFGIFVGAFAAIGITGLVKIITEKPKILTIISFIFSMVFFVIGVILLPYVLVVFSGISHFGMAFSVGGAYLAEATQISSTPGGDTELANLYFEKAREWFIQAEKMLEGLSAMGVFGLVTSTIPGVQLIVESGVVLMNAAVDLAKGVSPALAGFGAISRGMEIAMSSLGNSSLIASNLLLSQDDAEFERGLDIIERGFQNFTLAVPDIQSAISTLENDIDREGLEAAFQARNINVQEVMNYIYSSIPVLEVTLDVFTNVEGKGLIDDPDSIQDDTQRAPIVHLLLGAKSMNEAQELIGDNTSFQGTSTVFAELVGHLEILTSALDPNNNPAIQRLDDLTLDASAPDTIVELKNNIANTVKFLKDVSSTTINIGNFGIMASPTLTNMNTTLTVLTGNNDFTNITSSEYDNAISVFDGSAQNVSTGIVTNTTQMRLLANDTNLQISEMENNSNNDSYGFFNEPAKQFVTEFKEFDLLKNAKNFNFIAIGFSSLLKGMKQLTFVNAGIDLIQANVTIITDKVTQAQQNATATQWADATDNVNDAQAAVQLVKQELIDTNSTLQVSKSHVLNASISLNKTIEMPQMDKTADALVRISIKMENIQVGNGTEGLTGISAEISSIETHLQNIEDEIAGGQSISYIDDEVDAINANLANIQEDISYIESQFTGIQSDLGDVSIAA